MVNGQGLFVTGTDTGIGKTRAALELIAALRRRDIKVAPMKPVAAGCVHTGQGLQNDDALALMQAAGADLDYATVNPYALPLAVAPVIAAAEAGICISTQIIEQRYSDLASIYEVVVVEGAGGWRMDLATGLEMADLVRILELRVVLVVGVRLGCINHARLTAEAIRHDGCELAGWAANFIEPGYECTEASLALLGEALGSPPFMQIPYGDGKSPATGAVIDQDMLGALYQHGA